MVRSCRSRRQSPLVTAQHLEIHSVIYQDVIYRLIHAVTIGTALGYRTTFALRLLSARDGRCPTSWRSMDISPVWRVNWPWKRLGIANRDTICI